MRPRRDPLDQGPQDREIGSLVKSPHRAYKAVTKFLKDRKWANKIINAVEAACPVGPNSFIPGTLVLMADGSHKPIEKVKPGDNVLATDPLTGRTVPRVVVAALTSAGTDGPHGNHTGTGTVTATDTHSFWIQDPEPRPGPNLPPGHWTNAADLHTGDHLRTPTGQTLPITTLLTYTVTQQVHNLTVDTNHTYNVLAG